MMIVIIVPNNPRTSPMAVFVAPDPKEDIEKVFVQKPEPINLEINCLAPAGIAGSCDPALVILRKALLCTTELTPPSPP